ncbi:MAG: hypothetical protein QGD93_12340, partial [Actinomycetota bacterium]|nr:hypothetical protein [Actinomycetota bacterium]
FASACSSARAGNTTTAGRNEMNEHYEMIYSPTMSGKLREAIKAYFRNTVTSPKWTWPRWLKHSTTTGAMHLALSVTGDLFAETSCKLNHEMIATLPEVHSRLQAMGVELDRLIQSVDETLKAARGRDEALNEVRAEQSETDKG